MRDGWELADHVCATCLSRILYRRGVWRCSGCGNEAASCKAICGCGMSVVGQREKRQAPRAGGRQGRRQLVCVTPDKPAGFRCGRNPHRTVRSPAEIVLLLDGQVVDVGEDCP